MLPDGFISRSKYRQVKTIKHARAGCELYHTDQTDQHEKKTLTNLLSIQSVGFEQRFLKSIEISFRKNNFLPGKKAVVETISVTITDSCNVGCLDLYLINISTKAERCTDNMFKLTLYCLSVTVEDLHL